MNVKFLFLAMFTIASVLPICHADETASDTDLQAVLRSQFPEYSQITGPFDYQKSSLRALDRIKGDILVGDFNSDDIIDFAAKIARPIRDDEIAQVRPSHRGEITTVQMIVTCNGQSNSEFRCYEISEATIGGIAGTLDYFDWERYLSTLDQDEQPECQSKIRSRIGSKSLSLVEPVGHCDVFYYPREDGNYDRCMYCAD